jgi:hypothetical protein
MSLQYRKSKSLGHGARLNVSKRGMSMSQRVGPLTLSSRGRGSLRIMPGLSYRFGKKQAGPFALIMLAVVLVTFALQLTVVAVVALFWIARLLVIVLIWLGRWAVFGTVAIINAIGDTMSERKSGPAA